MRSKLNICLLFFSFFNSSLFGQKVAVIEKNIFPSLLVTKYNNPHDYKLSIRELFEKTNGIWIPVDNSLDEDSAQPFKSRVQYLLEDDSQKIIVKGIRYKRDMKSWLASELFRVENPNGIKLHQLPESILQGFEHNDIVASSIVTDTSVSRKNISLFKTENLTDTLKNKVYELLVAKSKNCYPIMNDTTYYFMAIKKTDIHNEVRVIGDNIKLGEVDIVSGNNCFAGGRSYGGGILHYIIYPNQDIKLLVTNTALIDVADYDNDGKLEYIFFKSWFNDYGYIMYYDNFQKQVVTDWSYH